MTEGFVEKKAAKQTIVWLVFAFVLLLAGNIFSFIATQKVNIQSQSVNHTNLIIDGLDNILSFTSLSESSVRGYLISEDDRNYSTYILSTRQTDSTIEMVKVLTRDNLSHQRKIEQIRNTVKVIQGILADNIEELEKHKGLTDSIRESTADISSKIGLLKQQVNEVQSDEKTIWQQRSDNITNYIRIIKFLGIITTLIAVLLTIFAIFVFNKENKAKKEADKHADEYWEQLQNRVTELANVNKELIELRGIEKFASTGRIARTIAHEVRNPLTNINLATEQLKTEFEGSQEADMFLDMISRNSVRINKLVSNLLNATRLTEMKKTPVAVNDLMEDCIKDAADRIKLSHINIVKNYGEGLKPVAVDEDKIKIAFLNLIVNGIEAMTNRGTLTVSTCEENGKCCIKVTDTGSGMNKDQLTKLFEPFFTTKKSGNGLGLANTHNIILSHDGSISCESKEGEGTTFTVILNFA